MKEQTNQWNRIESPERTIQIKSTNRSLTKEQRQYNGKKDRLFNIFFLKSFIYFERGKERAEEGQRERARENPKQASHCQHGDQCGARSHEL